MFTKFLFLVGLCRVFNCFLLFLHICPSFRYWDNFISTNAFIIFRNLFFEDNDIKWVCSVPEIKFATRILVPSRLKQALERTPGLIFSFSILNILALSSHFSSQLLVWWLALKEQIRIIMPLRKCIYGRHFHKIGLLIHREFTMKTLFTDLSLSCDGNSKIPFRTAAHCASP